MAIVIGEAVQSLRDNDADLVELKGLTGTSGTRISNAEVRELAEVLAVNTTLTNLDLSKTWLERKESGGSAGDRAGADCQHHPHEARP